MKLHCCPTTTQEKTNLLSSETATYQKLICCLHDPCSKVPLTETFLPEDIQKTWVFIQISISKNSKKGWMRSCEDIFVIWSDIWQQNHAKERKFLCTYRIWIKHIEITKCDLFFHCPNAQETSFYYFCDTQFCAKHKKHTWIPFKKLASCFNGKWMVLSWPFP